MKQLVLLGCAFLCTNVLADDINLSTKTQRFLCQTGIDCNIAGWHDIEIINSSNVDKSFNYSYSICADNNKCHDVGNKINVKAHTKWNNHFDNYFLTRFNFSGNHQYWVKTTVWGAASREMQEGNIIIVS